MESTNSNDVLLPRLLLFLSVDVVGSTAYKNRRAEGVRPWLPFFEDFYKEFPVLFQAECKNDIPVLWKSLGDELIFVVDLKTHVQATGFVDAFKKAIESYSGVIKQKGLPLALKASAWTAGFPVTNAEIRSQADEQRRAAAADYIGPSIDVGFRLGKFASVRKFVVSVELAIFLTARIGTDLKFRLGELHVLKGVLEERPYPIVWIDMYAGKDDELEVQSERLIAGSSIEPCNIQFLNKYCRTFIERCGWPLMIPFIQGDIEFGKKPDGYDAELEKLKRITSRKDEEIRGGGPLSVDDGENKSPKIAELERRLKAQPVQTAEATQSIISVKTRSKKVAKQRAKRGSVTHRKNKK